MLAVNEIITKINNLLAGGSLTQTQVTQLSAAVKSIEDYGVSTVATATDLPNPVTNVGRFFYIVDEEKYTFSNGTEWGIEATIAAAPVNLFAWGSNGWGQLGINKIGDISSPVSVVGGYTDWVQVSGGSTHSIGLRANGTLWAWGQNGGRLGDDTATNRSSPVLVAGGFTDWVQVDAGNAHSLGLRANGTLWAWGGNSGALGDDTSTTRSSPVSVVGGFTDWIQVSAGVCSLGVRANGTAWGWGFNSIGQLGDNTIISKSSPVSVVGGFTDWIQVSAGGTHSHGLRANGTAWAWGTGQFGRLGNNDTVNTSSPVSVVGGFTDWTQISAGLDHGLGLRANGTVWAWGENNRGHLGDGTTVDKSSPVSVVGGYTDWVQVDGGNSASFGVRANGTAWAWGSTINGKLGDNSASGVKTTPVSVVGGFTDWVQVSAGHGGHTHGIRG